VDPGTKRIALGGLVLAVLAWALIQAALPRTEPQAPEVDRAAGLSPLPEHETKRRTKLAPPSVDALAAVMVGCFAGERGDGGRLQERYRVVGGAIEGEVDERDRHGDRRFHETLRIVRDGDRWSLRPAPGGVPAAVAFALVEHGAGRLRFAAPDHDYPRTIEFERRGTTLTTRVDGVEGGLARSDRYSTVAGVCG